jgi:5'-nucleotidase
MSKKHILVTNDDGANAPGLLALAQQMKQLGEVSILAPDRNWSGGGHVKTIGRPLRVRKIQLDDGTEAYASDGAPSDCVALGVLGFFSKKIDLVVSGINPMPNFGHDVTYSGTVTAAMEAVIWDVPGIAFSLGSNKNHLSALDYGPAAQIAHHVVQLAFENKLPQGVLLNVNIPEAPMDDIKGYSVTRQGTRLYHDRFEKRIDPRGEPYYWISGDAPTGIPHEGTDIGALHDGYVSVTPIQLDLTAYPAQQILNRWQWKME